MGDTVRYRAQNRMPLVGRAGHSSVVAGRRYPCTQGCLSSQGSRERAFLGRTLCSRERQNARTRERKQNARTQPRTCVLENARTPERENARTQGRTQGPRTQARTPTRTQPERQNASQNTRTPAGGGTGLARGHRTQPACEAAACVRKTQAMKSKKTQKLHPRIVEARPSLLHRPHQQGRTPERKQNSRTQAERENASRTQGRTRERKQNARPQNARAERKQNARQPRTQDPERQATQNARSRRHRTQGAQNARPRTQGPPRTQGQNARGQNAKSRTRERKNGAERKQNATRTQPRTCVLGNLALTPVRLAGC